MNGRGGGCCIARYSGNDGGGQIRSKVDKIMLKYRPIAPKPMATGSGSSSSTVDHNLGNRRRRKRKYTRVNGNKSKKVTKTVSNKRNLSLTLSLMPETPADRKENSLETSSRDLLNHNKPQLILLSCNNQHQKVSYGHVQKREVISYVTMECVTGTWINGDNGLGFVADHVRLMNMEMDTCPSFITDSRDTVVWTNKAYKEMTAAAGGGGDRSAAAEVLVKKCNLVRMPVSQLGFTCKMKVTWGSERGTCDQSSVTAPCDVWRLRNGGYAWRLDVKAALCLGR
ncbi:uncharacterized protein [Rutidosis leptorrhynchoides]|uniref:uncharacterized protein n=1 Tax=Rutidosis leptorrhynchoides TaxID=125765 RepID=UPI003A995FFC